MIAIILRAVQLVLLGLMTLAIMLVLFTAAQFNLQGSGTMAALALAFFAASRAVGWVLAGVVGPSDEPEF